MLMRIKLFTAFTLLFFLAGSAHARPKIKVDRKAVAVSSSTPAGTVVVWGEPGSVSGARPVAVKVSNKGQKVMMGGTVREDGSFSVTLPGYGGEKLKVKFIAADGVKKSVHLRVPVTPLPPPAATITIMEEAGAPPPSAEAAAEEAAAVEEVLAPPPVIDVEPVIPDGSTSLPPAAEGEPIVPRPQAPAPVLEEEVLEPVDTEVSEASPPSTVESDDAVMTEEVEVSVAPATPPVSDDEKPVVEEVGLSESAETPAVGEEPAVTEEVVVTGEPAPQPVEEEDPDADGEVENTEIHSSPRVGEEVKDSAGEAGVIDAPVYTPAPDDYPAAAE
ncbi:MAG: hypothetical protein P9M00_08695 [Candidatus Tritonobacter lacicola]|nr:hypothetical protein [Candidatus Tritonobacter lacicola]